MGIYDIYNEIKSPLDMLILSIFSYIINRLMFQ